MRVESCLFAAFLAWLCLRACTAHGQDAETLLTARVCESETRAADSNAERAAECVQICHATAERAVLHHHSYLAAWSLILILATGGAWRIVRVS